MAELTLNGIVEDTFGGRMLFRGFATLNSIAIISEAKQYQRPVDNTRIDEIINFMKDGKYKFFPEIILSLQFEGSAILSNIRNRPDQKTVNLSDGIKIKKYKFSFQTKIGDNPYTKIMSITFPSNKKILGRIDGNHRLSAVDKVLGLEEKTIDITSLKQTVGNMIVPFSILLQQNDDEAKKYETAYFHLINAKTKPLTSEQNLKTILDAKYFNDSEIQEILGNKSTILKAIIDKNLHPHCTGIKHITDDNFRTVGLKLVELLNFNNTEEDVRKILEALKTIDRLYSDTEQLKNDSKIGLLVAFLYYAITNKFSHFKEWVLNNHIFNVPEIEAKTIIDIFEQISTSRKFKLFVAMPYWSHSEINEYNKLYKEICSDISRKAKIELELIPIMRFRGKSQRIDRRLLDKIDECSVFIADITGNNINVIFEVGYAEHKNVPMILLKNESDETIVPFDMDKLQYLPYANKGYYNDIKAKVINNLTEILRKDLKIEF